MTTEITIPAKALKAENAVLRAEVLDRAAQLVEQECKDHDESIRLRMLIRGLR